MSEYNFKVGDKVKYWYNGKDNGNPAWNGTVLEITGLCKECCTIKIIKRVKVDEPSDGFTPYYKNLKRYKQNYTYKELLARIE